MLYEKEDMLYSYNWAAKDSNDNPKVIKSPDSDLLNRTEGYEMRDFINSYAERYKIYTLGDCQKLERIIKEDVPQDIRVREEIMNWIRNFTLAGN